MTLYDQCVHPIVLSDCVMFLLVVQMLMIISYKLSAGWVLFVGTLLGLRSLYLSSLYTRFTTSTGYIRGEYCSVGGVQT